MPKPLKIGLTGGIGAGKSSVLALLARKGVPVLQTDRLGHELLREGSFIRLLRHHLGPGILDPKGGVDRKKLGRSIFNDVRRREKLNRLLHPEIRKRVATWVARKGRSRPMPSLVVVEVPLLFERGFYRFFDKTISVSAPKKLRHGRLKKRGWGQEEISQRERSQWSQGRKDQMADWVIRNEKGLDKLKESVVQWLCHAREGKLGTSRGSNRSRKVF